MSSLWSTDWTPATTAHSPSLALTRPRLLARSTSGSQRLESVDFSNNVLGFFPKWSFKVCIGCRSSDCLPVRIFRAPPHWSSALAPFQALKFINVANNDLGGVIPTYFSAVVPAGEPVVILPQRAALCGTLPEGPRWAEQDQSGSYRAISSLPPNAACGEIPPPAPFPPPGAVPPPPPTPPPTPPSSSGGLSTGAIIGIAVGGSVGLILLVGLFFVLCRPKQTVRIVVRRTSPIFTNPTADSVSAQARPPPSTLSLRLPLSFSLAPSSSNTHRHTLVHSFQ